MRIAVVGAGISGLGAAWLLSRAHDVTLFEREPRLGGHSNTSEVTWPEGGSGPVDTGFIVYNTACYPNLIALFEHLAVPTARTDMSFAVSLDGGGYEYSGTGAQGLFGQPSNLLRPGHWRMAADILRFFREAPALLAETPRDADAGVSLGEWLNSHSYSRDFVERHILPMGAAIWSTPSRGILDFPAAAFARFFANHGLLQVRNRPEWRTVDGGSREYVARLMAGYRGKTISGDAVVSVARGGGDVVITRESGAIERFDRCLIACHADDALALLGNPDATERTVLGAFRYSDNLAVLHRDLRQMPRRRRLWSSWNYMGGPDGELTVSYWMNRLQPLTTRSDHFVTLNPATEIPASQTIASFAYRHPMYDGAAIAAQSRLWSLQGRGNVWFAGSYFGWGFHEDGLQAGLAAAEDMSASGHGAAAGGGGVRRPWSVAGQSSRITTSSAPRMADPAEAAA